MSDSRWHYEQDNVRHGPFSAARLQHLATVGELLRTATVWKEGVLKGALATRVKHLFPESQAEAPPAPVADFVLVDVPLLPLPLPAAAPLIPALSTLVEILEQAPLPSAVPLIPVLSSLAEILEQAPEAALSSLVEVVELSPEEALALAKAADVHAEIQAMVAQIVRDRPPPQQGHVRQLRVRGLTGAILMGQDGAVVSFRKKCPKCGHEDSTRTTMQIRNGAMTATYFCPKCRKSQPVRMQGVN